MPNPFRYFNSSPEVIRAAVLLYVKYPLSLRNVEDLLAERGIDVCHATVLHAKNATAVGSTIGLRIRTSRFGDANVPCIGSGEWVRCRNSRRCTHLFTTTSITNAISSTAPRTRPVAPPPRRSGGSLQADISQCWIPGRRCRYIDSAYQAVHTTKGHRRYRYYVTKEKPTDQQTRQRLPADELENHVSNRMKSFFAAPRAVADAVQPRDAQTHQRFIAASKLLANVE